ncbi:MAG: hypothetical protein IT487_05640 [Chromatiaceae bacterium]|nr:hypothetical protein [Chromatiaceae bacterium]
MATNQARPIRAEPKEVPGCGYLGASSAQHVWLIYPADLDFIQSRDAAPTPSRAVAIVAARPGKPHRVCAAARFVSQRALNEAGLPVAFAPFRFTASRERPQ